MILNSVLAILWGVFSVVFTFGLVIFFHELGHFIVAKKMGVAVEKFSLGFGRELVGFMWKGTRMLISQFPLGGYVKMKGENPDEDIKGDADDYRSKKWYQRICIVGAGPVMNFILGILIFTLITVSIGMPEFSSEPVIGGVQPDSPAERVGLLQGDKIVEINGTLMNSWDDIVQTIHPRGGEELALLIQRDGARVRYDIIPEYNEEIQRGLIGIVPMSTLKKTNIFKAVWHSIKYVFYLTMLILRSIFLMLIGQMKPAVAGPVGIASIIVDVAGQGIIKLMGLIGVISVSLAVFNLFPIPVLDGGHIMFLIVEGIKGKPIDTKKIKIAQMVGLAILLVLILIVTSKDIIRIIQKLISP